MTLENIKRHIVKDSIWAMGFLVLLVLSNSPVLILGKVALIFFILTISRVWLFGLSKNNKQGSLLAITRFMTLTTAFGGIFALALVIYQNRIPITWGLFISIGLSIMWGFLSYSIVANLASTFEDKQEFKLSSYKVLILVAIALSIYLLFE